MMAEQDQQTQSADLLHCYLSTLVAVAECIASVCPEIGKGYSERLLRWPRRLGFNATPKAIEESRIALRSELESFSATAGQYFREVPARAAALNDLILKAFGLLQQRTENYHKLIESLSEQMEMGADLDDMDRFRRMLRQQAIGLRASSAAMLGEIQELLGDAAEQAQSFKKRLENPDYLSATDESTGLLSKEGALRQLRTYVDSSKPFCALLFTVEGYADMPPDQRGPVIKRMAQQLVELIRPTDVACRWAEDRFFVIFQCDKAEAEPRARQIAAGLSDSYTVSKGVRKLRQQIQCAFSIVNPEELGGFDEIVRYIERS